MEGKHGIGRFYRLLDTDQIFELTGISESDYKFTNIATRHWQLSPVDDAPNWFIPLEDAWREDAAKDEERSRLQAALQLPTCEGGEL